MSRIGKAHDTGWRGKWPWRVGSLPLVLLLPLLLSAQETKFVEHGFEGRAVIWVPAASDAKHKETAHSLTNATAHNGHRSEFIEVQAAPGTHIHYTHGIGRAPVADELSVSLWVKANRPGTRFMARVVLPHERDPQHLDRPLTTFLRGDVYQTAGRWQRLEVRGAVKLLREQQRLLRAELKRDVTIADAYVDQVLVNVYSGPGLTRVWTDDLEIGPVAERKEPVAKPAARVGGAPAITRRAAEVKLERDRLMVTDPSSNRLRPFFLRGIRYSGTPLKTLRDAGFNAVWIGEGVAPEVVKEAVAERGFWIIPMLEPEPLRPVAGGGPVEGQLTSTRLVARRMSRFLHQDAVLCWDLGGGLAAEQAVSIAKTAQAIRTVDPMRPLAVDVWDGFRSYTRGVDQQLMLGVHRWPLMTGLELTQYRDWLNQRRNLAQPGTYSWTWIQTHLPEWFTKLVYEKPSAVGFSEPIGPQPEQIRLLTYTAIASGAKGLGFWSDRFLADTHTGRDRLLQMALLNQELQLLEPLLVTAQAPVWVDTSVEQVKAAVMRTDHGVLCLPVWLGSGSQFVPGQAAAPNLTVVVPGVPQATQPWLVSPGEVRTLRAERVPGGTKITIPEFGLTAAVVFTGDLSPKGLVVYFQNESRKMAQVAAQWAHDLAEEEYAKVSHVNTELEKLGHRQPDGTKLLEDARRRLVLCANHRRNRNPREAYAEARRALRPLRILMRAHWDAAVKGLDTPTASPYAVSFYTLPRHWRFREEIAAAAGAPKNVLPGGGFEQPPAEMAGQWQVQEEKSLDEVTRAARRVRDGAKEGKQSLLLEIKPNDPKDAPAALERTFLAVHSPKVKLPPGTLVRVTGWVRVPEAIKASVDGALFFDSIGGEPLAARITGPVEKWRQLTLYRRVPATGELWVTLAMTGLGKVYFDDIRIEPLSPAETVPTARRR